ncbi:GTPase HflX [Gimesia chilikensis]|uniref:GTPase HflX n=1 Tax=Gimesia chilikensis TaxID=2605989 RepID=UPI0011F02E6D|nr:GTPase HflX [Gimesia chilikensis]KAA0140539.1 GTPase HflX [Gimesia chilikensis]
MADPKREELQVKAKRAILVSVISPSSHINKEQALDELKGLVETAGVKVVGTLVQSRENPHPATCLGKGKLAELKSMVKPVDAELIIFDNNLSPSQGRNIEEETGTIIVDRSELILDIFATHAKTYEAKLQVELAQLLYFRPRLKRLWTHLERIEGGVGAGRGPGEKQLETDRRLLDKRVAELKRKLSEVEKRRERTVSNRFQQLTVSLVGYTNAGKSTLMNALTGADVYIADQLFATLDTRTRRWELPHWGEILLSDTVGFVRNLPHHLVASFKSTLEEARQADLLLHVVDSSNPEVEHHIKTVNSVLEEIGIDYSNALLVFNKSDKVEDRSKLDVLRLKYENAITVSAVSGEGLDRLSQAVIDRLASGYVIVEIETPVGNGKLLSQLEEHSLILSREYSSDDTRVTYRARIARRFLPVLKSSEDTEIRIHDDGDQGAPNQLQHEESIHEV